MLITLEEVRELGVMCKCVGKHVPLPMAYHKHHIIPKYLGGTDSKENLLVLCPTTHYNVHALLQHYGRYKGTPPGSVRKHYSDYVQGLAKRAWEGRRSLFSATDTPGDYPIIDPWWEEQGHSHEDSSSG